MIEFITQHGWHIATALTALIVFYDKFIAPYTKTKKDDEILERMISILPDEIVEKLLLDEEDAE